MASAAAATKWPRPAHDRDEPGRSPDDMAQGPDADADRAFRKGRKDREWRQARRRAGTPARPTAPEL